MVEIRFWEFSESFIASSAARLLSSLPWPDGISVIISKPTRYAEKNSQSSKYCRFLVTQNLVFLQLLCGLFYWAVYIIKINKNLFKKKKIGQTFLFLRTSGLFGYLCFYPHWFRDSVPLVYWIFLIRMVLKQPLQSPTYIQVTYQKLFINETLYLLAVNSLKTPWIRTWFVLFSIHWCSIQ